MSSIPAETASLSRPVSEPASRRRGAQPGNLNALKHGRYLVGVTISRAASIDPGHLSEVNELIATIKKFMRLMVSIGLQTTSLAEANQTLRSLGVAAMGLTRLINLQQRLTDTSRSNPSVLGSDTPLHASDS